MTDQLSIIFCIRDRDADRLRNCFSTLRGQKDFPRELEIILVDDGSSIEYLESYRKVCQEYESKLIPLDRNPEFWKTRALNVGIKQSDPASRYIVTSDVDMIYAPNFLANLWVSLEKRPERFVTCGHHTLRRNVIKPGTDVVSDFNNINKPANIDGFRWWPGPCESATRDWFFKVRGFDERFVRYGPEDADLMRRAQRSGFKIVWIHDRTTMLHQWHTTQWEKAMTEGEHSDQLRCFHENQAFFLADKRIIRNHNKEWGELAPRADLT